MLFETVIIFRDQDGFSKQTVLALYTVEDGILVYLYVLTLNIVQRPLEFLNVQATTVACH